MKIKSSQVILDCHFENNFARGSTGFIEKAVANRSLKNLMFFLSKEDSLYFDIAAKSIFSHYVTNNWGVDKEAITLSGYERWESIGDQGKTDAFLDGFLTAGGKKACQSLTMALINNDKYLKSSLIDYWSGLLVKYAYQHNCSHGLYSSAYEVIDSPAIKAIKKQKEIYTQQNTTTPLFSITQINSQIEKKENSPT